MNNLVSKLGVVRCYRLCSDRFHELPNGFQIGDFVVSKIAFIWIQCGLQIGNSLRSKNTTIRIQRWFYFFNRAGSIPIMTHFTLNVDRCSAPKPTYLSYCLATTKTRARKKTHGNAGKFQPTMATKTCRISRWIRLRFRRSLPHFTGMTRF